MIAVAIISIIRGIYEGFIFDTQKGRDFEDLIHKLGTILLALVYVLSGMIDCTTWLDWVLCLSCYHLIFFYLHLGFYHQTRNQLNKSVYPLGFRDWRPQTSKSWWDNYVFKYAPLTYKVRLLMAIVGVIGYVIVKLV